jgi:hypothetical protein
MQATHSVYWTCMSCSSAAGCKTNFQICIEVTVATAHPTRNLVEFQQTPAGRTRPTYTVCGLL